MIRVATKEDVVENARLANLDLDIDIVDVDVAVIAFRINFVMARAAVDVAVLAIRAAFAMVFADVEVTDTTLVMALLTAIADDTSLDKTLLAVRFKEADEVEVALTALAVIVPVGNHCVIQFSALTRPSSSINLLILNISAKGAHGLGLRGTATIDHALDGLMVQLMVSTPPDPCLVLPPQVKTSLVLKTQELKTAWEVSVDKMWVGVRGVVSSGPVSHERASES